MSCAFSQNTIKVPEGNSWQMLLPLKTAKWRGDRLVTETIDYRALEDIAVFIDGVEYDDWQMTEDGPLVNMPAGQFEKGPHNTVLTALYFGVEVKASYFENFTIVAWSFESNVGEHLQESPLISDPAYIYVGITDDQELEDLKQQYRNAIASCETARLQYEAAKEAYDEKAEALDDVAKQSTLMEGIAAQAKDATVAKQATLVTKAAAILEAIGNIHVDIPDNIATQEDVTAAKQAILTAIGNNTQTILDALQQISPVDEYSQALAAFFGITPPVPDAVPMTQQEVEDDLDELWNLIITQ